MATRRNGGRRRKVGSLIIGGLAGVSAVGLATGGGGHVHAANNPTAIFALGSLTVIGTGQDDVVAISRDAAGTILVNGGAVPVFGGTPTVANTRSITLLGLGGRDALQLDEANGALPKATIIGGGGDDALTGGSAGDLLIGQSGNDTLDAEGGTDRMFGGLGNDTLTGGDADDQAFGEGGDDAMIWNPGEDTDLNEGGDGIDTTIVNGAGGNEQFTVAPNGARVRFDRLDPAPFAIDMGTTEKLVLNAGGGDDSFSATGDLAPLLAITADGGAGNDNLLGGNGVDLLIGGDGNDVADGQQGNDVAFMGAGDDTFQWDPGDGSDVVEGQDGTDSMLFNGSAGAENFETTANGGRVRFTRNLGNIVMDLDDVEGIDLNALAGSDNVVLNDMSGTDLRGMDTDLANPADSGTPDADADTVTVNATQGDDVVVAASEGGVLRVEGLATALTVTGASPANDRLFVNTFGGVDVLDASLLVAPPIGVTADMGGNDDVAIGGDGDDVLRGGDGDDVLLGGPGTDTLDGGAGDNVLIDGESLVAGRVEGDEWLATHTRIEGDRTLLDTSERSYAIPEADLT